MFDIAIIIVMLFIAIKGFTILKSNSGIFEEFGQSKMLTILVFLYPVAPLLLALGQARLPRLAIIGMVIICYLPSLVVAVRQNKIFECAGTDRVNGAQSGLSYVMTGAIIGLLYLAVGVVLSMAFSSYDGS